MSASHEWEEWHLTPRGWERGRWKSDGPSDLGVPTPTDRVLSRKYHDYMSSGFSKLEHYFDEVWLSSDAALMQQLISQFKEHPSGYENYTAS